MLAVAKTYVYFYAKYVLSDGSKDDAAVLAENIARTMKPQPIVSLFRLINSNFI